MNEIMNNVVEFVAQNYEAIAGVTTLVVALIVVGRKRAVRIALGALGETKKYFIDNIDEFAPTYAKYIYKKLPVTARVFIRPTIIEKIIVSVVNQVDKLDKNN